MSDKNTFSDNQSVDKKLKVAMKENKLNIEIVGEGETCFSIR